MFFPLSPCCPSCPWHSSSFPACSVTLTISLVSLSVPLSPLRKTIASKIYELRRSTDLRDTLQRACQGLPGTSMWAGKGTMKLVSMLSSGDCRTPVIPSDLHARLTKLSQWPERQCVSVPSSYNLRNKQNAALGPQAQVQHVGGRGRQTFESSRPTWSTCECQAN